MLRKKIDSFSLESVKNHRFREIVSRYSHNFGIYPGFIFIISDPKKSWYQRWGNIILRDHPDSSFSYFDIYLLLIGLNYHGILPSTEINRLLVLAASKKTFGSLNKDLHGLLIALFSTLGSLAELTRNTYWRQLVTTTLKDILRKTPKFASYSPLNKVLLEFYRFLAEGKTKNYLVKQMYRLYMSDIPVYIKARGIFSIIKDSLRTLDDIYMGESFTRKLLIPITPKDILMDNNEKYDKKIDTSEIELLAKVDFDLAKTVAKHLDTQKNKEKLSNRFPAFSTKKHNIQKLLYERRFLASTRRFRVKQILSVIEEYLNSFSLSRQKYGYGDWHLGENDELLDIEVSAETYGRVIPSISTIKNVLDIPGDLWGRSPFGHIELCIDTSGSMDGDPIEHAIDISVAFVEIAKRLHVSVGLSTFSSGVWEGFPPSRNYEFIEEIILRLDAEGGTNIRHALGVISSHIDRILERSIVVIITDSLIYDIDFPETIQGFYDLASKADILLVVLDNTVWHKTMTALSNISPKVIIMGKKPTYQDIPYGVLSSTRQIIEDNLSW